METSHHLFYFHKRLKYKQRELVWGHQLCCARISAFRKKNSTRTIGQPLSVMPDCHAMLPYALDGVLYQLAPSSSSIARQWLSFVFHNCWRNATQLIVLRTTWKHECSRWIKCRPGGHSSRSRSRVIVVMTARDCTRPVLLTYVIGSWRMRILRIAVMRWHMSTVARNIPDQSPSTQWQNNHDKWCKAPETRALGYRKSIAIKKICAKL